MKHTEYKKGSAKSSFVQALLLVAILLVGYLGISIIKRGDFSAGLNKFINMDVENMRPLQAMPEEEKETFKKKYAGFWVSETKNENAAVKKYDCLELKENGIIWQVITWKIRYPDGDTGLVYHVRHGYMNPYSMAANDKDVVCEVRTIRQVYVNGADTCFGAGTVDELWQGRRPSDSLFVMNRQQYVPYRGELNKFFPAGMIDLIDALILNDCAHNYNVASEIKDKMAKFCEAAYTEKRPDSVHVHAMLTDYFIPSFVEELFASIPYFPVLPDSIVVPLRISSEGKLVVALSKSKLAQAGHFETRVFGELQTWRVASEVKSASEDKNSKTLMQYTIRLPSP